MKKCKIEVKIVQNQEKINEFQDFFIKEYRYLKSFAKSINPQSDYEDLLHSCYLKARDRIAANGYEGQDFLNYTRCVIMNTFKTQYKKDKKIAKVDIEDHAYYAFIEDTLLENEYFGEQQKEKDARDVFLTTMIYEYLDKYCSQKDVFIFKTYYLLKHKHLNYRQLADTTGYSMTTVSNTIKRIKKELRANLNSYILTGKRENE